MKQITINDDEKFLRQISKPVDFKTDDVEKAIKVLEEYCLEHEVFAMASVQLGIPLRIIYLKNTRLDKIEDSEYNESRILINPEIILREGHTTYWEACASCLDNMALVHRPYKIKLRYLDSNQKEYTDIFEGFESTVLSHEYDHLNGILHMDIAEKILVMPKEERKEFRKEHGYKVLSKTGPFTDFKRK